MYRLKVTQYCNLAGMKPVTASRTGVITHTIETNFIPTVGSTFSTGNVGGEVETIQNTMDYLSWQTSQSQSVQWSEVSSI